MSSLHRVGRAWKPSRRFDFPWTDMNPLLLQDILERLCAAMFDHSEELTALDRAIGDGDHGLNMKRGFENVRLQIVSTAQKPLGPALQDVGRTLVMKVGGASGPLFGTLFTVLGKSLPEQPTLGDLAIASAASIDALRRLGKSDAGQKTMLDVLIPVQQAIAAAANEAPGHCTLAEALPRRADAAAQATVPMKAIRGRASFLGERSIGHMDPGARSAALMVRAVCAAFTDLSLIHI